MLGVEGVLAESLQGLLVNEWTQVFHIPGLDCLDLVAGADAVEDGEERHAAAEGAEVGHRGEVHHLLHRALGEEGEARLAGAHHVGVVAEDGEGLGGQGAGAHVEHAGVQAPVGRAEKIVCRNYSPAILYRLGIISSRPCEAV